MKALVVYESFFGNTEQVARAIAGALGAAVLKASDVKPERLAGLDLLVVGSATRAFRPTPGTTALLGAIRRGALEGTKVAAFDTRMALEDVESKFLRFMAGRFGYAAAKISAALCKKGGTPAAAPAGFIVCGEQGPMRAGELERAAAWARKMV